MSDQQLPENGITIKQAKDWTQAWQTKNPDISKAFLIPTKDIISLFKELKVLIPQGDKGFVLNNNNDLEVAIRAYLAIGPSDEIEKDEEGQDEEKLVLVGAVDVNGEYQDQVEETRNTLQVTLSGSGAFDFTRPCPKFCDRNSPLNHG